jgi:hypothetical protein
MRPDGLACFGDDLPCRDTYVDSVDDFNSDGTEVRDQVAVVIPEYRRIMSGLLQHLGVDFLDTCITGDGSSVCHR